MRRRRRVTSASANPSHRPARGPCGIGAARATPVGSRARPGRGRSEAPEQWTESDTEYQRCWPRRIRFLLRPPFGPWAEVADLGACYRHRFGPSRVPTDVADGRPCSPSFAWWAWVYRRRVPSFLFPRSRTTGRYGPRRFVAGRGPMHLFRGCVACALRNATAH